MAMLEHMIGPGDKALAPPRDDTALVAAVVSSQRLRRWFAGSDRAARQVAEALCLLSDPTLSSLSTILNTKADHVRRVLDRLVADGVAILDGEHVVANPGLRPAIPHPAGLGPSLRPVLEEMTLATLAELAKRIGVEVRGPAKAVVDEVLTVLSTPARVAALAEAGPPGTVDIVKAMSRERLELRIGYGGYQPPQTDRSPEGWLMRRGLIITSGWGAATMSAEVALALRGGRPFEHFDPDGPELSARAVDVAVTDQLGAERALDIVGDVALILESWAETPGQLLQAGGLGVRELRRLAKMTGRSEQHVARLVDLASFAGLIGQDESVIVPTDDYDRWCSLLSGQRWEYLVYHWLGAPHQLSLSGSMGPSGKPVPPLAGRTYEPDAVRRRLLILALLAQLPAGAAAHPDALAARAEWAAPALWRGGPTWPVQLVNWTLGEADMLGVTADGALTPWGRVLADGEGRHAGEALQQHAPPVAYEIVLQADLTAVVVGEITTELRRQLDLMADVESSGAASVFRFSEASLRRWFDAGQNSAALLDFLAGLAPKGVPQTLAYLIEDIERRYGKLRVGAAQSFLRSDDTALLEEVVRAKKVARLGLRLLAPTVAVSRADPDATERALRDAGYLAATEGEDGTLIVRRRAGRRVPSPREETEPDLESDVEMDLDSALDLLMELEGDGEWSP